MPFDSSSAISLLNAKAPLIPCQLSQTQIDKIAIFISLLVEYNSHTNLVSNADPEILANDHILDSLALVPEVHEVLENESVPPKLIDIGTGAGFPGLILAIVLEDVEFTLVDSVAKKTRFVADCAEELSLNNVEVITGRAEELGHDAAFREQYGAATARALGASSTIMELAMPLLAVGGALFLQKSLSQRESEMKSVKACAHLLGGELVGCMELDAKIFVKEHVVIKVHKKQRTSRHYPREWLQIKNKPLT